MCYIYPLISGLLHGYILPLFNHIKTAQSAIRVYNWWNPLLFRPRGMIMHHRLPDNKRVGHYWFMPEKDKSRVCIYSLRLRQSGRHFPDDIVKCIFIHEHVWISMEMFLKFVPECPINNIPALAQIMAWRLLDDKPLPESRIVSLPTHRCVIRLQWVKSRICIYCFLACNLLMPNR